MPKVNSVKVDGISFNADHAKKIGKDAFVASPEFEAHYPDMPEAERHMVLAAAYDQIVAQPPTPSKAAASVAKS